MPFTIENGSYTYGRGIYKNPSPATIPTATLPVSIFMQNRILKSSRGNFISMLSLSFKYDLSIGESMTRRLPLVRLSRVFLHAYTKEQQRQMEGPVY